MSVHSARGLTVAGNWKMNGSTAFMQNFAADLAAALATPVGPDLLIFPPALHLAMARTQLPPEVSVGAQNIHGDISGAFTGEQSAEMLADLGVQWCLVGHSERRALFAESNADTAVKVAAAERAGVNPILCLGETIDERNAGQAGEIVLAQLDAVLDQVGLEWLKSGMIAYEPVWAIGTGETATPDQAQEMHALIRQALDGRNSEIAQITKVLYGGSMTPENARELLEQADIDGGLVGGASLTVEKFVAIARAVG